MGISNSSPPYIIKENNKFEAENIGNIYSSYSSISKLISLPRLYRLV